MNRRSASTIAGNPVLIGAATVLVILVAVFLSYNANSGLPFVPVYELRAQLPSGANLVAGNEVRIGGARVGVIRSIAPQRRPDGSVNALIAMKLERSVAPLPKDSTLLVRSRSALGLKYVEITRGRGREGYRDGDTIPLGAARPAPVEFDEVVNTFDEPTRAGARTSLRGFGDALAGRGADVNAALGELAPLLKGLEPVARNLSDPRTGLSRFVSELADAARIVAPAAETQAALFRNLDATFAALRDVRPRLQESITSARPALDAAIRELPRIRPFLANSAGLFDELRPGVRALRSSAPILTDALVVGRPTLRRLPALNRRLGSLLAELGDFSRDPVVPRGLARLTETVRSLRPTLDFLAPTQTRCNYAALFFRNVASLLSEGDANGTWQRFIIVALPLGPNSEQVVSNAPANGPTEANHLHVNPYPNTGAAGQDVECEAAREKYAAGRTIIGNEPGNQGTQVDGKP